MARDAGVPLPAASAKAPCRCAKGLSRHAQLAPYPRESRASQFRWIDPAPNSEDYIQSRFTPALRTASKRPGLYCPCRFVRKLMEFAQGTGDSPDPRSTARVNRACGVCMRDDWKKLEGHILHDKFPLQKLLGSTSHSAVFLTQSPPPQPKTIAIKFVTSGAKADSQTSFLQRASKLRHPNLLRLLPGGRCRLAEMDLVFAVMEYAEENLGQVLPYRPLSEKEAREVVGPLLDGLNYIHSQGFAHCHIKPSNIMATDTQLKISSDTALPLGEPRPAYRAVDAYDAPEAATAPVGGSSDVWSLGVTLVELLTQQAPVSSPESRADPIVPSTIPQPFLEIALHCLRRDPRLRWTTAQIADCLNLLPSRLPHPQ